MATGIEGYLQIKILDGHRKFMVTNEFWARVAREFGNSRHVDIETKIGPATRALDHISNLSMRSEVKSEST